MRTRRVVLVSRIPVGAEGPFGLVDQSGCRLASREPVRLVRGLRGFLARLLGGGGARPTAADALAVEIDSLREVAGRLACVIEREERARAEARDFLRAGGASGEAVLGQVFVLPPDCTLRADGKHVIVTAPRPLTLSRSAPSPATRSPIDTSGSGAGADEAVPDA